MKLLNSISLLSLCISNILSLTRSSKIYFCFKSSKEPFPLLDLITCFPCSSSASIWFLPWCSIVFVYFSKLSLFSYLPLIRTKYFFTINCHELVFTFFLEDSFWNEKNFLMQEWLWFYSVYFLKIPKAIKVNILWMIIRTLLKFSFILNFHKNIVSRI